MRSNATPGSGGGIPFYDKFVYALSSGFSSNLAVYIFSYYLTFFLVDIRGLPARLAGFIVLGSRDFDTVTDILIGMLIDRTHIKSGKYRGWIKLGMIPMLVGLPLIFADLGQLSMTVKIIWTVITYGLYGSVFTTILYTPTNAQLVNMTRDVEKRSSMVGLREIFNNVAVMLVSAGFLPLVQLLGGGDEDRGFFLTTAVLAVLAFVFQLWNLMMQRKYELNPVGSPKFDPVERPNERVSLLQQIQRILQNRPAVITIAGMLLMNILMATKSGLMIYYFKYCFDSESFFSLAMVFFTVASVVGAMLIERFVHLFRDSNRAFLWIMAISMGLNALYFLLILGMGMGTASRSIHFGLLFFVLIFSGLFQGAHYGFPTLLLSNAVDYGEWKTKRSDIGVTFGLNSLAMSLGSAIGGTLAGFFVAWWIKGTKAFSMPLAFVLCGVTMLLPGMTHSTLGCYVGGFLCQMFNLFIVSGLSTYAALATDGKKYATTILALISVAEGAGVFLCGYLVPPLGNLLGGGAGANLTAASVVMILLGVACFFVMKPAHKAVYEQAE